MSTELEKEKNLGDHGIYLFMNEFNNTSVLEAIKFILEKNMLPRPNRPEHLTMIINSPGGNLHDAFALIDTIKGSGIPVHTVGVGCVMSCGLLTFMAGAKGHRVLTPNTSILSHQYTWGVFGKEHELIATAREYDLTSRRLINHYKKCTGMKEDQIHSILMPPHDVWMEAKEAVKCGIADRVVTTY
jgi:ATP-dependent Clp protease protease subunit